MSMRATFTEIGERVTDGVAVGAVSSPLWLPILEGVSQAGALALPVLGSVWLILQMYWFIKDKKK